MDALPIEKNNDVNQDVVTETEEVTLPQIESNVQEELDPVTAFAVHETGSSVDVSVVPIKRGRGRPRKDAQDNTTVANTAGNAKPSSPKIKKSAGAHQAAAITATNLFYGFGVMVFGEEFAPDSKDEAEGASSAFRQYLESTDMPDLPPGWALAATLGMLTFAKLQKPEPKSRVKKMIDWCKVKIFDFKSGKK